MMDEETKAVLEKQMEELKWQVQYHKKKARESEVLLKAHRELLGKDVIKNGESLQERK